MKMDFNTDDENLWFFFIRLSGLVALRRFSSLPDPTPSASSVKFHFHISNFDTYTRYKNHLLLQNALQPDIPNIWLIVAEIETKE